MPTIAIRPEPLSCSRKKKAVVRLLLAREARAFDPRYLVAEVFCGGRAGGTAGRGGWGAASLGIGIVPLHGYVNFVLM
jgi:hypothetical protein